MTEYPPMKAPPSRTLFGLRWEYEPAAERFHRFGVSDGMPRRELPPDSAARLRRATTLAQGPREAVMSTPPDEANRRLRAARWLVGDWQANGNSRPLGDPTADVWHLVARQLLAVLDGREAHETPPSTPTHDTTSEREESDDE